MPANARRQPASASDPIPEIDLVDPDPSNTSRLDDLFEGLRQEHSVFWHGPKSRPGFWAVIRYADAVRVYRDSETFSATHGMTIDSLRPGPDPASGMMVEVTDPPEHRRLRRSIGTFFTGGAIAGLAEPIDRYAASLLREIRHRGDTVDFADAVACRIPTYSAGLVLGLPREDLEWITARTSKVFLGGTPELRETANQANAELLTYFAKLVRAAGRGSGTGDGFVQRLAAGSSTTRDGLTTGEVVLNALNLAIGGTQTTRNVLTNLMHALLVHPGVLPALREAPSAVPTAIEEAVRWANPVRHLTRVAHPRRRAGRQARLGRRSRRRVAALRESRRDGLPPRPGIRHPPASQSAHRVRGGPAQLSGDRAGPDTGASHAAALERTLRRRSAGRPGRAAAVELPARLRAAKKTTTAAAKAPAKRTSAAKK
jgi:cytochrome P450